MNIKDLTEYLVKSIVASPDMVKVSEFGGEDDTVILEVIVTEADRGIVIGKSGRTARAIRTLVQAHAYINSSKRVKINIDSF